MRPSELRLKALEYQRIAGTLLEQFHAKAITPEQYRKGMVELNDRAAKEKVPYREDPQPPAPPEEEIEEDEPSSEEEYSEEPSEDLEEEEKPPEPDPEPDYPPPGPVIPLDF
jgi:hypothetical protein